MTNDLRLFGTIGVAAIHASKDVKNTGALTHAGTCNDALAVSIHVASTNNRL
jgi:hypothetical protein